MNKYQGFLLALLCIFGLVPSAGAMTLHCVAEDAVIWKSGKFEHDGEGKAWLDTLGVFQFDTSSGRFQTRTEFAPSAEVRIFEISANLGAADDLFANEGRTRLQVSLWNETMPFLYSAPTYLWTGTCQEANWID